MVKKLFLLATVVLGIAYGAGYDFARVKRSIDSLSNENARNFTAGDNGGWGTDSGY